MVVTCTETNGAIVNYLVFATIGCLEVPLQCQPPPGSLFPIGSTLVTCTLPGINPPLQCAFKVTVTCGQVGVSLSNKKITLSWEGGSTLQVADSPAGPWVEVTNAPSIFTVNASEAKQKFYRIR
jgi:hypothetical protein